MAAYEELGSARFASEMQNGVETIRIPARKRMLVLIFLCIWFAAWTVGGFAALVIFATDFSPYVAIWLGFWAIGWFFTAITISWQLTGYETLAIVGADLKLGQKQFGYSRSKLYRGSDIKHLSVAPRPGYFARTQLNNPFMLQAGWGSIKFDYGAKTVYAAAEVDEAEARMIIAHLLKRLPSSVVEG
jgi:hypothetical protein